MINVLVIGCGGIGSFFLREAYDLYMNEVKGTDNLNVMMVDDDEVEEKNIKYQNFEMEEIGQKKAMALNNRYGFSYETKLISKKKDLLGFDIIILAVDNSQTRKLVYEYCEENNIYFIDMRSTGRGVAFYTKHKKNNLKTLNATLDEEAVSTSCQVTHELNDGKIQLGNRIIANIGAQLLLNYLRDEPNIASYTARF
jgi:molybdopterin/thiamine biosynthesis adenylyltransferase